MSTVIGNCTPTVSLTLTPTTGFLTGQTISLTEQLQFLLKASGILADQIDTAHAKTYSFVASTAQTLDLTTLTDIFSNAISFARVRLLAIKIKSTNDAASLLAGNAGANEWTGFIGAASTLKLYPSTANADGSLNNHGFVLLSAPNTTGALVDATHKFLKLLPSAHAFDVDIIIAGCSA